MGFMSKRAVQTGVDLAGAQFESLQGDQLS
jgi:hypothetical protein